MLTKAVGVPKEYFLKENFAEQRIPQKNSLFLSRNSAADWPGWFLKPVICNGYKHSRLKKLQKEGARLLLKCNASTIWNVKPGSERIKSC